MLNEENNGYIPVEPFLSLETPLLVKKVYEEYTTKGRKNTTQEEPGTETGAHLYDKQRCSGRKKS
jgi:hypothetical protein